MIPAVERSIVLVEDSALSPLPMLYSAVTAVATWMPWLALILVAAGVWCAQNRRRSLVTTSISALVIMLMLGVGLAVVRSAVSAPIHRTGGVLTVDAMHVLYDTATVAIGATIIAVGTIAGITALTCWLSGEGKVPRALRGAIGQAIASVRSTLVRGPSSS